MNKSFDGNLIPHPHMSEDERAEMFYEECMDNAGITEYPPLRTDGYPGTIEEASKFKGSPPFVFGRSKDSLSKEESDEIESSLDFLSLVGG